MTYYIGTSGWSYDHWRGCFYPEGLAKRRWFEYYASLFNSVEVNATFYRRFKDETYHKWREQAPEGFRYVLKAPRFITHRHYLIDVEEEIKAFSRSAWLLKEKFGLVLLQLPPSLPYETGRLEAALNHFVEPARVAVEFRNDRWLTEKTLALLRRIGAGFCNPDAPGHPLSEHLTGKIGYLRLHGRRKWYADNYSDQELAQVARIARKMTKAGAQEVYIFFNNDFEGFAPANAARLKEMLP